MNVYTCVTNANTWGRGTTEREAVTNAFAQVSGSRRPTEMRVTGFEAGGLDCVFVDPLGSINIIGEHELVCDMTMEVSLGLFQSFDLFHEMLSDTLLDAELEAEDVEG